MDIHKAFRYGAKLLAKEDAKYTNLHKGHGIEEAHWELLTQEEWWSPDQARQIRTILANVMEASMTIAGMPAIPLPGHYAAAVIAEVVAPANRMVACVKAPDTFDADAASGIMGTHEIKEMSTQQLMSLVIAYSGGFGNEPAAHMLPKSVTDQVVKSNEDRRNGK